MYLRFTKSDIINNSRELRGHFLLAVFEELAQVEVGLEDVNEHNETERQGHKRNGRALSSLKNVGRVH